LIISASRRSDIPACFGDWLMQRVEAGAVEVPNPFSKAVYTVPLQPESTAAIVFWSKNYKPFLPKLNLLEQKGFDKFLFNFTITGLPEILEPNIPPPENTIEDFKYLSLRYWKGHIFWRFDPILITGLTSEQYFLDRFRWIADRIAPFTQRCIFSFAFFYEKVKRSLKLLQEIKNLTYIDPNLERKRALAVRLGMLAAEYGLTLQSCCCEYLEDLSGIEKAHCVDGELVSAMWGGRYRYALKPSREGCGCAESADIGSYGTCQGGCVYCYAR